VSKFDFTPAAAAVKVALVAEDKAYDAWRKASNALYEAGLRYSMIGGKEQDKVIRAEVKSFITSLLPEKKATLLRLAGREVAELDDESRALRKVQQQRVGVYLSRIANYLKAKEGIVTERDSNKSEGGTKAEGPTMPKTLREIVDVNSHIVAIINTVGLSARDAANAADHLAAFLAVTRTALAVIEKKNEASM
jgi:hypothetical protein